MRTTPSAAARAAGGGAPPARRADALRNRTLLLRVADELLASAGTSVSFDQIAKRAGVGVGTVYRHFPTREDLFGTVIVAGMRRLTLQARALATAEDPRAAFFRFFYQMVEQTVINKALCEAFDSTSDPRFAPDQRSAAAFDAALDVLSSRAKAVGALRTDMTVAEIRLLAVGAAVTARERQTTDFSWRIVTLIAGALRPDETLEPLPPPAVTKQPDPPADRNETESRDSARCALCGRPISARATGRPARYCGAACRQQAHRHRASARRAIATAPVSVAAAADAPVRSRHATGPQEKTS
ncbi:hypothetical protein CcI156_20345 [Frankia sp. CcI156]|jgi:AcrR family transcriptional regulator|nr:MULTISPECIES: TetR/AcrR family transcriptional regulator [Frankia]ETA00366.1 transcriptional regulator, TetR family [Frankia sp. CcI6]EYT89596.1 transcriptional regulator, TetR family [Frankia casuarinae]KDA40551.1 transcriptional regulator, TetR family [Frankia sp. BMG5.23]KFB04599.1 transcriptional regulator, TetR family [Frankia sp. Allo2]OAA20835.1 transcriptional regulator [Frankia casuarinae]